MSLHVVQSSSNAHNVTDGAAPTIHLTTTPTVGNWLVFSCSLYDGNGSPSVPTGLTAGNTPVDNGVYYMALVYRKVLSGDGKDWLLDNSGRNFWSAQGWEISGGTGVWATDFVAAHTALAGAFPSATASLTGFNTANNNEMILGFWAGNTGSGGMTSTITQSGQTDDGQFNGSDGALCYSHGNHVSLVAASGTAVAASFAVTQSADISYLYVEMQSAPAGETSTAGLAIAKMAMGAAGHDYEFSHAGIAIGKMSFNASSGRKETSTAGIAIGAMTFAAFNTFVRFTQFTQQALSYSGDAPGRLTQFGLQALGKNTVNARVTQLANLVLAKGGDAPITPDPLSIMDAGRQMTMRMRLINMYPEPTPQGPGPEARYQRGGLYSAAVYGGGPIQLLQHWASPSPVVGDVSDPSSNQFLYSISGGNVFRDNVNIGVVDPNVDPIWFPRGRRIHAARSSTQFMIASGGNLYSAGLTSVTQVPIGGNLPAGIRDIAFLAGRFVYVLDDNSGEFYYSDIGDGTTIDGLNFATASENDPLPLISVWDLSDDIVMFTTETTEFWYASSDPNNPYQRSVGRRYNKGLLAQDTVELIDNSLFWLGHDRIIYRTGLVPGRVSNFDVEDRIRRLGDDEVQQCYSHGVSFGGHNFYVIHLMSQGTWALDIASKTWAEWKSWEKDRYRIFCSDDTNRIFGDYFTGNICGLDGGRYNDLGDPLERICSSFYPLQKGRTTNFNLILHTMRGPPNAVGQGFNPNVEMRFSDAEGHDWTTWMAEQVGTPGDRSEGSKCVWDQLGGRSPPGRLFEFRATDEFFFAPYKVRVDEERP